VKSAAILLVMVILNGCSAALPRGESKIVSRWTSFEEAKQAYEQIVSYETRDEDLRALGFSPHNQPNVRILNHADLGERFMRLSWGDQESMPLGLRDCQRRTSACFGYEVEQRHTYDRRYGSFLADFFNFKRKVETRGWEFRALFVLIDGLVVYKVWGGTPDIREYREKTNPLGPLQGMGPSLTPRPDL